MINPSKAGEGVILYDWPNARNKQKGWTRGSKWHCPAHANCTDSAAFRRCKDSKWHRLCVMHELARDGRGRKATEGAKLGS